MTARAPRQPGLRRALSLLLLTAAAPSLAQEGFSISAGGQLLAGDAAVEQRARRAEAPVAAARIGLRQDAPGTRPELALTMIARDGQTVTVESRLNYPAFAQAGELLITAPSPGGRAVIARHPLDPGARGTLILPEGEGLALIHRITGAGGARDETLPLFADAAEGTSAGPARQRIPAHGALVTVEAEALAPGARLEAMGTSATAGPDGRAAIAGILPPGRQGVPVRIRGGGQDTAITREITVPRRDGFVMGTADLTFGRRDTGSGWDSYSEGRLAFYGTGRTASGWQLTGRADTGRAPLDQLLRGLDARDPRDRLQQLDSPLGYPVFGDDAILREDAPSDGRIYLRAERGGTRLTWGNYRAAMGQAGYLRNERRLYGAQVLHRSQDMAAPDRPRFEGELHAAQPGSLPGRDVFLGTGGSVYFLRRQEIASGSETLSIELRDPQTGRLIETRQLVPGRDYDINPVQGIVTLAAPLHAQAADAGIVTQPGGESQLRLVAQYEYTPAAGDTDGMSLGARAATWASPSLRLGVSALREETGAADQRALGADLLWQRPGTRSRVTLEYAQTEGPGFGSSISQDGGLIITPQDSAGTQDGTGRAWKAGAVLDLAEMGMGREGSLQAYAERREAGFSSLDYEIAQDETLWGLALTLPGPGGGLRFHLDRAEQGEETRDEAGLSYGWALGPGRSLTLGAEYTQSDVPGDASETGSRTDIGLRYAVTPREGFEYWLTGQVTAARNGGLERNNRAGAGAELSFGEGWSAAASVSDGDTGPGASLRLTHSTGPRDSTYLGYELTPAREISGVSLSGRDAGRIVAGGTRAAGARTDIYAENSYDMFGRHRAMTGAWGLRHRTAAGMELSGAFELGRVQAEAGDYQRRALSFGMAYEDESLRARARLELRHDDGTATDPGEETRTALLSASARYRIDDERRLHFALDLAGTEGGAEGDYAEATVGYAYRPVMDDRLNVLFKYTWLHDMQGQRIAGEDTPGPRQASHVVSVDANYDATRHWTLGAKLGARLSESAPDADTPLARNDAWLAVVNARYHVTHSWDLLVEGRHLEARQAGLSETSALGAVYRHVGQHAKIGLGYNFGSFSDDLTDLVQDDRGIFINLVAKF